MNTYAQAPGTPAPLRWIENSANWLDERGKLAWIAALVISFATIWPVGLAILAYMIWRKRMFGPCKSRHMSAPKMSMTRSSGNAAFDAYRDETLRRLQDEQASFEGFLDRLRQAKDKAEFDQFMNERAAKPRPDAAPDAGETGEDSPRG